MNNFVIQLLKARWIVADVLPFGMTENKEHSYISTEMQVQAATLCSWGRGNQRPQNMQELSRTVFLCLYGYYSPSCITRQALSMHFCKNIYFFLLRNVKDFNIMPL